ncbi:hypothetical protein ACOMHN_062355 [Nucella lapillus]
MQLVRTAIPRFQRLRTISSLWGVAGCRESCLISDVSSSSARRMKHFTDERRRCSTLREPRFVQVAPYRETSPCRSTPLPALYLGRVAVLFPRGLDHSIRHFQGEGGSALAHSANPADEILSGGFERA